MSNFNIQGFMSEFKNGFQRPNQYRCKLNAALVGGNGNATGPLGQRFPKACELLQQGLLCENTRTPSRSFETQQMTIFGYEEKFPVFTTFTDLDCTFLTPLLDDPNFGQMNQIAELFHAWQSMIQPNRVNDGDNMVVAFPEEYRLAQGMELELLTPYNTKRAEFGIDVNISGSVFAGVPILGNTQLAKLRLRGNTDEGASGPTQGYQFFNIYPLTVDSTQMSWDSQNEFQKITVTFAYSYWTTVRENVKSRFF